MTLRQRSVLVAPLIALVTAAAVVAPVGPLASADQPPVAPTVSISAAGSAAALSSATTPTLAVTPVVSGLDIPWDVAFVGKNMLFTERDRERLSVRLPSGEVRTLFENPAGMWHAGETGLMGLAVSPNFSDNRWVYTCNGFDNGATKDIRVVRWQINAAWTAATELTTIVPSIGISSGRHGGCRLQFTPNGALYVGTGDSAVGTNPQDLGVLNGKVLRVDENGAPWPTNPFIDEANPVTKKIFTYGHRNVQGLSARHRNQMWSAEHGTYRDDEVNKLKPGGNYGWNPVPGYDESKPMTDHSLPGRQIDAKWSSGEPTIATSGMAWLRGDKWGNWEGRLAVAALAGSELLVLEFSPTGELISEISVAEFDGDFGRLRAVELGPQNNLYVTTSNGGSDRILEVTP